MRISNEGKLASVIGAPPRPCKSFRMLHSTALAVVFITNIKFNIACPILCSRSLQPSLSSTTKSHILSLPDLGSFDKPLCALCVDASKPEQYQSVQSLRKPFISSRVRCVGNLAPLLSSGLMTAEFYRDQRRIISTR
jgi:hypothetical protein